MNLGSRLTYANLTATLALVLAASGGAYAAGLVTGQDIVNNSITGKDIKKQSIKKSDLSPQIQTQGPQGPAGAAGPAGPAGATDYSSVTAVSASNSESPKEISVNCPAGTFVLGTTFDIAGGKTGAAPNQYTRVVADKVLATGANGVLSDQPTRVYFQAYEAEAIIDNWSIRVGATCAAMTP